MSGNTWPEGKRRAMHQHEHATWNATHYPGTRQMCSKCDSPTGRCEEDSIYIGDDHETWPLCEECAQEFQL